MLGAINQSQTFGNKTHSGFAKLKTALKSLHFEGDATGGTAKQVSVASLRPRQPLEDSFSKNLEIPTQSGALSYLRSVTPTDIRNKEVEGIIDIGAGTLTDSKARNINAYGDARVLNSSAQSTYVGGNAILEGGDHGYLNIQNEGKVSNAKATHSVLSYKAKLSNSSATNYIEANDLSVLENVQAPKIIINGLFPRLKGKNNRCDDLQANIFWRILHLEFRTQIKPKKP